MASPFWDDDERRPVYPYLRELQRHAKIQDVGESTGKEPEKESKFFVSWFYFSRRQLGFWPCARAKRILKIVDHRKDVIFKSSVQIDLRAAFLSKNFLGIADSCCFKPSALFQMRI